MILERAEHPKWTSNAYLVADAEGGHGVLVDSNGVEAPLLALIDQHEITITHVLVTHQHADHVVDVAGLAKRFGVKVVGSELTKQAGVPIDETFRDGLIEHPQYTRPRDFRGMQVPDILLSGNHAAIARWRLEQRKLRTKNRRPDLWSEYEQREDEKRT